MKEWLLVVAFFSPGGDYMSSRTWEFATHNECLREMIRVNKTVYPLNQRAEGRCVLRDKMAGI